MSMPMKSALKSSTAPISRSVVTPAKALSESNIAIAMNPPKSEIIKGVLKKNGYIPKTPEAEEVVEKEISIVEVGMNTQSFISRSTANPEDDVDDNAEEIAAFNSLDCSKIESDASKDDVDFDFAVESMMSQMSSESAVHSQNLSIHRPTKAFIEQSYKGPKPDGIWKPPDGIISPPSAQLCRTTKAVEAQKYDDSKRPVTPGREKKWVNYTMKCSELQKDAFSILKGSTSLSKRTGPHEEVKNDLLKPTQAVISHQYKKPDPNAHKSAIWEPPKVIIPPSGHLLKTTSAVEKGKWTKGDVLRTTTPEKKREQNWKKYPCTTTSISDTASVGSQASARSRSSSANRPGSATPTVSSAASIARLTRSNAALRSSIKSLEEERFKKKNPYISPKVLPIMTNQRILTPTHGQLAAQIDAEEFRNSVKPEEDPWWEKREGKSLPRSTSSSKLRADTPSRLHESTESIKLKSIQKYSSQSTPIRSRSPAPFQVPSDRLLRATESQYHRIKSGVDLRSSSAKSERSGSVSSRSHTPVHERLLVPTESFMKQKYEPKEERVWKSPKRPISPDLLQRLEAKTIAVETSEWHGSRSEQDAILAEDRRKKLLIAAKKKTADSLLVKTKCSTLAERAKSPMKSPEIDPLDVGRGWIGGPDTKLRSVSSSSSVVTSRTRSRANTPTSTVASTPSSILKKNIQSLNKSPKRGSLTSEFELALSALCLEEARTVQNNQSNNIPENTESTGFDFGDDEENEIDDVGDEVAGASESSFAIA